MPLGDLLGFRVLPATIVHSGHAVKAFGNHRSFPVVWRLGDDTNTIGLGVWPVGEVVNQTDFPPVLLAALCRQGF